MEAPADPAQSQRHRSPIGPICLAISSLLLLVFPLVRPFTDRTGTPAEVAATFASTPWVAAHILAGLGFILLPIGLLALSTSLREARSASEDCSVRRPGAPKNSHRSSEFLGWAVAERLASQGLVLSSIGIGLILPTVFGTEAFALRAIGQAAIRQKNMDLLALAMSIRMGPQARFFFLGLLVLAIGAVVTAVAVWRSGVLPRWSGVLFALGLALFFPLFPRAIRIVDGMLIGVGGVWIAVCMLRWDRFEHAAARPPARGGIIVEP